MSLYRYFENKEALLDGMVDFVFAKIYVPVVGGGWRNEMHSNAHSLRSVLLEHRWALSLIETRTNPGPATLGHHNAVVGTLSEAGFTMELVAKAFAVLDAYTLGFVLQEITLPFEQDQENSETVVEVLGNTEVEGPYPHLMALATQHLAQAGYDFGSQFDFGLNLLLDGLAGKQISGPQS